MGSFGERIWSLGECWGLNRPGEIPGRGCFPSKVMSSLCPGGDASLRRQMPAWEGGQGPRDRSWAEAKTKDVGVVELKHERMWGEKEQLRTEPWEMPTVAGGGGGGQEKRGSRRKGSSQRGVGGSPIFSLYFSAALPLLPTHLL